MSDLFYMCLSILFLFASANEVLVTTEDHPDAIPYPWTAVWGLTSSQFQTYLSQYAAIRYMPVQIDGYAVSGVIFFAVIAEKRPGTWSVQYNLTQPAFNLTNTQYANMGYHLQRISVYDNSGVATYAGIWVNLGGFFAPWQFNSGLTLSDLNALIRKMTASGYWPIQVEMYALSSSNFIQFAAIFQTKDISSPPIQCMWGLPAVNYTNQLSIMKTQGYHPSQITAVTFGGQPYFGAIWQKSAVAWATNFGLTAQTIQTVSQGYIDDGYQFADIQGYFSSSGVLYSVLWDVEEMSDSDSGS